MFRQIAWIAITAIMGLTVYSPAFAQDGVVFPEPTGDYRVGVAQYPLVDASREEIFTEEEGDPREVLLTVYYPAEPAADAEPAPYAEAPLKDWVGVPAEVLDLIQPQVYTQVPVAEGQFPVLIFSPGMGNLTLFYTSLLTEVASHGYVVAGMWHPYSTAVTVFPDGRVVGANDAGYLASNLTPEESQAATERIGPVWTGDALFVLDQLEQLNGADALLAGHLDLEHVGIFGHSFGGGTAAEASYVDSRFDAGVSMDGALFGNVKGQMLSQPFMVIRSTNWESSISDELLADIGLTRDEFQAVIDNYVAELDASIDSVANGYSAYVEGATHQTFSTDFVLVASLLPEAFPPDTVGTLSGERAVDIFSDYTVAFFDQQLKGEAAPLLAGPSADYPEVAFTVIESPSE